MKDLAAIEEAISLGAQSKDPGSTPERVYTLSIKLADNYSRS
jgi:hypothetical protein